MTSDLQALGASALCKGASHRTSVIRRCGGGRGASGGRWHSCGSRGSHGAATAAPTRGGVRALRGGDTYAWRALASGWSAARRRRSPRPAGRGPERAPCEARWAGPGVTRARTADQPRELPQPSPGPAWGATAAAPVLHTASARAAFAGALLCRMRSAGAPLRPRSWRLPHVLPPARLTL